MIPIWDKQKLNRGRVFEYLSGNNDRKKNGGIPENIEDLLEVKGKKKNLKQIEAKYINQSVKRTKRIRKKMVINIAEIKNELYADLSTFRAKKKVRLQMVNLKKLQEKLSNKDERLKHKIDQTREICEQGIEFYLKGFSPSLSAISNIDDTNYVVYEKNMKILYDAVSEVENYCYCMDNIVERGTCHEKTKDRKEE